MVDLDVACWSGHAQLQAKDLGLTKDKVPDIFRLGRKRLIAAEALLPIRRVERQAREFLRGWAFHFPIAGARFVPKGSLGTVVERFDVLEKDFGVEVQKFLDNFEAYKQAMLSTYTAHREALEAYYPSLETLKKAFGFNYVIYAVEVPESAGMSAERRNALKDRVTAFADEVSTELRKQTAALFTKVSAKLAKGEVIRQDTFKKIQEFTTRFELLDFMNDREIRDRLARIRRMVDKIGGDTLDDKEQPDLRTAMTEAVNELVTAAGDLSDLDAVTGEFKRRVLVEE